MKYFVSILFAALALCASAQESLVGGPRPTDTIPFWLSSQTLPIQINGNQKWTGFQAITDRIRTNCNNFTNRSALGSNTVDAALISLMTNSAAGTCICLSNGVYNIGTNTLAGSALTNGVTLIGQSMSNTIITWFSNNAGNSMALYMSNNTSLINLTVWAPSRGGTGDGSTFFNQCIKGGGTNKFLGNVLCIGDTDTIRWDGAANGGSSQLFNVASYSKWDALFPDTNCFLYNCYIFADDTSISQGYDGNTRAVRVDLAGTLNAKYCTFEVTNTARQVSFSCDSVVIESVNNFGSYQNCTFISSPVGFSPAFHIDSAGNNLRQQVSGGIFDPAKFTTGKVVVFP